MQEDPRYDDVVSDVKAFLEERLAFAVADGVPEDGSGSTRGSASARRSNTTSSCRAPRRDRRDRAPGRRRHVAQELPRQVAGGGTRATRARARSPRTCSRSSAARRFPRPRRRPASMRCGGRCYVPLKRESEPDDENDEIEATERTRRRARRPRPPSPSRSPGSRSTRTTGSARLSARSASGSSSTSLRCRRVRRHGHRSVEDTVDYAEVCSRSPRRTGALVQDARALCTAIADRLIDRFDASRCA